VFRRLPNNLPSKQPTVFAGQVLEGACAIALHGRIAAVSRHGGHNQWNGTVFGHQHSIARCVTPTLSRYANKIFKPQKTVVGAKVGQSETAVLLNARLCRMCRHGCYNGGNAAQRRNGQLIRGYTQQLKMNKTAK
jgi:hypothetical protein